MYLQSIVRLDLGEIKIYVFIYLFIFFKIVLLQYKTASATRN